MKRDQKQARQIVARGVSAWDRDDFEAALATFVGVLKDFPSFADVQNKAGLCLAMLGRREESLGHFEAALELNPSYAEAHLNRGIILNELGCHDDAEEALDKAGELDHRDSAVFPSDVGNRIAVTHAQLGDLYLVANRPEEAAQHYETGLTVRPRFMDIRSKFAESLIQLDRLDEARSELEHILDSRAGFVREWRQCLEESPEDMRPRAYSASVGIGFPNEYQDSEPESAG